MKSGFVNEDNMGLLTDMYQLTMDASYLHHDKNGTSTFDYFIRKLPENRSYFVVAGLEQVLHYLENVHFDEESGRVPGLPEGFQVHRHCRCDARRHIGFRE